MRQITILQYPRGQNRGGELHTEICSTISISSWQYNCVIKETEYEDSQDTSGNEERIH